MALPMEKARCTFADILTWDECERAEIICGEVVMMSPPPSTTHQEISFELCRQLGNYLKGKQCKAYPAPFAVRLFEVDGDRPEDVDTMVEPDISIICDKEKLDDRGCNGAPDWIIEIVSPSSRQMDYFTKLFKYRTAGVREYWIVNPQKHTVMVYDFEKEERSNQYNFCDDVPVCIYEDFIINIDKLL